MSTPWIDAVVHASLRQGVVPQSALAYVVNASYVHRTIESLRAAFPPKTLHAFAAKANPLKGVLQLVHDCGMGCETASIGEFKQALLVFPSSRIILDSPCKTMEELRHALYCPGAHVNVDNFQELERVVALNKERPVMAHVGIRVNTQQATGSIGAMATGTTTSKFGIGLLDAKAEIAAAYAAHPFLDMIHVHSGSQGLDFAAMTGGVRAVVDLVLNDLGGAKRVPIVDIGGGMSVNFASDEFTPTFAEYAAALRVHVPELFDEESGFRMVTEFGRAILAKAGVFLSRAEYVKTMGGRRIVLQHCGADLLIRTVWVPQTFPLRVEIYAGSEGNGPEAAGTIRVTDPGLTDVAGPCCIAGDLVARARKLPLAYPNDVIVIRDVGAYYYASFSYYNMRQSPAVYFYDETNGEMKLTRDADSVEQTMAFFRSVA